MLVTVFQNFICSDLIMLFVMAYDHILDINKIDSEPRQIKYWPVSFVVEYRFTYKGHVFALEVTT